MTELNLPPFDISLRRSADGTIYVFDSLRRTEVVLTPEEWVRQHFVNFLTTMRGFPRELMANEVGIRLNGATRRCDTIVYDRHLHPLAIVEYKAPSIAVSQKVFDQIARYNIVLNAPFLIVSNGMRHYCCRFDFGSRTYAFLRDIPFYADIAGANNNNSLN